MPGDGRQMDWRIGRTSDREHGKNQRAQHPVEFAFCPQSFNTCKCEQQQGKRFVLQHLAIVLQRLEPPAVAERPQLGIAPHQHEES